MTGEAPESEAPRVPSDAELISLVRAGELAAFDELYLRHVDGVRRLALKHADNASDADDLVADAFAAVFERLRNGGGPDIFFRGYVYSTVTRMSYRHNTRSRTATPTDDMGALDATEEYRDPVLAAFEAETIDAAFNSLPERWRSVLWYAEVEGLRPAEISPLLGLSPNGVSALTRRAREGLRSAYLTSHLSSMDAGCQQYAADLGAYAAGNLPRSRRRKIEQHVPDCESCQAAVAHLRDVGGTMRGVIFPMIAGVSFVAYAGGTAISGATPAHAAEVTDSSSGGTEAGSAASEGAAADAGPAEFTQGPAAAGAVTGTAAVKLIAASVAVIMAVGIAMMALMIHRGSQQADTVGPPTVKELPAVTSTAVPAPSSDASTGGSTASDTSTAPGTAPATATTEPPAVASSSTRPSAGGASMGGAPDALDAVPPVSATRGTTTVGERPAKNPGRSTSDRPEQPPTSNTPQPDPATSSSPNSPSPTLGSVASGVSSSAVPGEEGRSRVTLSLFVVGDSEVSAMTVAITPIDGAQLVTDDVSVPGGWSCSTGPAALSCHATQADRSELTFAFGVQSSAPAGGGISYRVSGDHLAPHSASYQL